MKRRTILALAVCEKKKYQSIESVFILSLNRLPPLLWIWGLKETGRGRWVATLHRYNYNSVDHSHIDSKELKAAPRLYPRSSCFDQGMRIQHDLLTITQPPSTKMSMGKARLTIVMLSLKEEKLCQKLQFCDELDQWPRRGKAPS
jgi:hypothetical protein